MFASINKLPLSDLGTPVLACIMREHQNCWIKLPSVVGAECMVSSFL